MRDKACVRMVLGMVILQASWAFVGCTDGRLSPGSSPVVDNVLLVSIDSLRPDHLGVYGYKAPTSPEIDRIAALGVVFDRAYTTTSWTLPAHVSMLTGLDNDAHGVTDDNTTIPIGVESVAQAARRAGVQAVGFFSGPYLLPAFGFGRGFDEYIDCTSYAGSAKTSGHSAILAPFTLLKSHKDVTNPTLLSSVQRFFDQKISGERIFLFLHMWDVHYDYNAPARYLHIFDPEYTGSLTGDNFQANKEIRPNMSDRDFRHLMALYDAEIRYTDDTLAQILSVLEESELVGRTAIIVVSDHGEEFLEHGRKGHRLTLYEEVLRVPLIISVPGLEPASRRVDSVVSIIDLYPTICELLGLDCREEIAGQSLLRFFRSNGDAAMRGDALAEVTSAAFGVSQDAIIGGEGKIIRWNNAGRAKWFEKSLLGTERGGYVLDPRRKDTWPASARALYDRFEDRMSEAARLGKRVTEGGQEAPRLDTRTKDRLRSLGYIE